MCLACEQDAIWLAYLESRGLLKPDDPDAVDALFSAFPVQPLPAQEQTQDQKPEQGDETTKPPKNPFACDDPTAE
jgi:hypothetical protein